MSEKGNGVVVAMYKYEAQMGDELSLRVGDIIRCVSMRKGMWWYGKLGSRYFISDL